MTTKTEAERRDATQWTAVEEAVELLHEERSREALVNLRDVLRSDPKNAYAYFFLGVAFFTTGEIAAARDTATNPQLLDAFALAVIAFCAPPVYPGMPGGTPDLVAARSIAGRIRKSMDELLKVAPGAGAYLAESDYFQLDWQNAFWGTNYPRLAAVKRKYDPDGLFVVHHGVGSEAWSADGFTRV